MTATDAQSWDLASFIGNTDMDHANVRGEHGGHQTHPLLQNGQRLVVVEEEIGLGWSSGRGDGPRLALKADRLSCRIRGIDTFREIIDERSISSVQGGGQETY